MTNDDIRRGHQVLSHLATINTGLGRKVPQMLAYEAEHGHLPADELRTLSILLHQVAVELQDCAEQLDQPVLQA